MATAPIKTAPINELPETNAIRPKGPRTAPLGRVTTLVRGATISVTTSAGEAHPDALLGLFDRDTRFLSSLIFLVDDEQAPVLTSARVGASSERIVHLGALDQFSNGSVIVTRTRTVVQGSVEEFVEVRSLQGPRTIVLCVELQADGAGVLALKSAKLSPDPVGWEPTPTAATVHAPDVCCVYAAGDAEVIIEGATLRLRWKAEVDAKQAWTTRWTARPEHPTTASVSNAQSLNHSLRPKPEFLTLPRLQITASDYRWQLALDSAIDDLEALIVDEEGPDPETGQLVSSRFIAAGAPWFIALFGRDMLLSAWQLIPLGTELPLAVLTTLARFQGTANDARRLEAPGKILHERRIGTPQVFGLDVGQSYFGTLDASPLFVVLLAECLRWGAPPDEIAALLPAARAALRWCCDEATTLGPADTSPFLWYQTDERGLQNQAWKDSGDCMVHADGRLAVGPFAPAEVQGYFYDALIGMAELERSLGDASLADAPIARAASLRIAFETTFWSEENQLVALALDGDEQPLRVASSNMGQCLWSGILRPPLARQVANRVMRPDLRSDWGIRTLGDQERAYNPLGYHLGTVWAHDTAIIAAGMARHGFRHEVRTLVDSILGAAEHFEWRLPELYGGLNTTLLDQSGQHDLAHRRVGPLPYPASCSPQAWSAGAPLLLLRAALQLEPAIFSETQLSKDTVAIVVPNVLDNVHTELSRENAIEPPERQFDQNIVDRPAFDNIVVEGVMFRGRPYRILSTAEGCQAETI
jgi:glycogen debranching enzyme